MISPDRLAHLWNCHANSLQLLVRARCEARAEDVVQETFIRLARQPQPPDDVLAWLARTARNVAIDWSRQDQRRRRREERYVEHKAQWLEPINADQLWDISAAEVSQALRQLSFEEHEIVVAHIWNAMSFRQIADAFQLSSSSANRRYLAALGKLREALASPTSNAADRHGDSRANQLSTIDDTRETP